MGPQALQPLAAHLLVATRAVPNFGVETLHDDARKPDSTFHPRARARAA
jgi:hypothetical protein